MVLPPGLSGTNGCGCESLVKLRSFGRSANLFDLDIFVSLMDSSMLLSGEARLLSPEKNPEELVLREDDEFLSVGDVTLLLFLEEEVEEGVGVLTRLPPSASDRGASGSGEKDLWMRSRMSPDTLRTVVARES